MVHIRYRKHADRILDNATVNTSNFQGSEWALERPRRSHLLEAERVRQEMEELSLIAQGSSRTGGAVTAEDLGTPQSTPNSGKSWYQFWKR